MKQQLLSLVRITSVTAAAVVLAAVPVSAVYASSYDKDKSKSNSYSKNDNKHNNKNDKHEDSSKYDDKKYEDKKENHKEHEYKHEDKGNYSESKYEEKHEDKSKYGDKKYDDKSHSHKSNEHKEGNKYHKHEGKKEDKKPHYPHGNNGTLKVHEYGTPSNTHNNDPKVCAFNLEGFGFDANQSGYIKIDVQGGDKPAGQNAGPFNFGPTNAQGYAASQYFNVQGGVTIKDGHYKATLYGKHTGGNINLADVKAKSKVFKVRCATQTTPHDHDVCSNIEGKQKTVPAGMKLENGKCVTPTTPSNNTDKGQTLGAATPAPAQAPATLAKTGEGINPLVNVLIAVALLIVATLSARLVRKPVQG